MFSPLLALEVVTNTKKEQETMRWTVVLFLEIDARVETKDDQEGKSLRFNEESGEKSPGGSRSQATDNPVGGRIRAKKEAQVHGQNPRKGTRENRTSLS